MPNNENKVPVSKTHFDKATGQPFKLGLIPTPPEVQANVARFCAADERAAIPTAVAFNPKLQMWGNDQYGDCVSAQEAFAKACCGIQIPDDGLITWAGNHDLLNGAMLTDVMDLLAKDPFVLNDHKYGDGPYQSVDYKDESAVCAAIATFKAPLNIAIDHSALPSGAGNQMGWYSLDVSGSYTTYDHCVGISGYGPAKFMFPLYGAQVPTGVDPEKIVFGLFTWKTIGLVDVSWFQAACSEMYVRNPTTTTDGAPGPDPILVPGPDPVPPPPPPVPPTPVPTPGLSFPWWVTASALAVGLVAGVLLAKLSEKK